MILKISIFVSSKLSNTFEFRTVSKRFEIIMVIAKPSPRKRNHRYDSESIAAKERTYRYESKPITAKANPSPRDLRRVLEEAGEFQMLAETRSLIIQFESLSFLAKANRSLSDKSLWLRKRLSESVQIGSLNGSQIDGTECSLKKIVVQRSTKNGSTREMNVLEVKSTRNGANLAIDLVEIRTPLQIDATTGKLAVTRLRRSKKSSANSPGQFSSITRERLSIRQCLLDSLSLNGFRRC